MAAPDLRAASPRVPEAGFHRSPRESRLTLRSVPADPNCPPEAYRSHAGRYDQRTWIFHHWRELLVTQLPVRAGDTVLDIGCGTGLCLPMLYRKIGPTGGIVGIDESAAMLELAADRVTEHGWDNVQLIAAAVDQAPITVTADAALFCAVHDILQSSAALANVFSHLRPGAPVAAIGGKWPGPWPASWLWPTSWLSPAAWLWPLRTWVASLHAPYISDFTGFDRPWELLGEFIPDLNVQQVAGGTGYLAHGHASAH